MRALMRRSHGALLLFVDRCWRYDPWSGICFKFAADIQPRARHNQLICIFFHGEWTGVFLATAHLDSGVICHLFTAAIRRFNRQEF